MNKPITDEMVRRALAERVELIQGFSYPDCHCIRDFRNDGRGVEVWKGPIGDPAALMVQLNFLKMKARLVAALSFTPCPGCDGYECDNCCRYPGAVK